MVILLTILHVIVCLFLVIVVLLQSGKAADLAGAFGGMGSQTAFGPRGAATVLSKATTVAAALFMITSLSLAIVTTRSAGTSRSVLERQSKSKAGTTAAPAAAKPVTAAPESGPSQTIPLPMPERNPAQKK
jgi:preprotein translocase subunit SecG